MDQKWKYGAVDAIDFQFEQSSKSESEDFDGLVSVDMEELENLDYDLLMEELENLEYDLALLKLANVNVNNEGIAPLKKQHKMVNINGKRLRALRLENGTWVTKSKLCAGKPETGVDPIYLSERQAQEHEIDPIFVNSGQQQVTSNLWDTVTCRLLPDEKSNPVVEELYDLICDKVVHVMEASKFSRPVAELIVSYCTLIYNGKHVMVDQLRPHSWSKHDEVIAMIGDIDFNCSVVSTSGKFVRVTFDMITEIPREQWYKHQKKCVPLEYSIIYGVDFVSHEREFWGCRLEFQHFTVVRINNNGLWRRHGVRRGDKIIAINGISVDKTKAKFEKMLLKGSPCSVMFERSSEWVESEWKANDTWKSAYCDLSGEILAIHEDSIEVKLSPYQLNELRLNYDELRPRGTPPGFGFKRNILYPYMLPHASHIFQVYPGHMNSRESFYEIGKKKLDYPIRKLKYFLKYLDEIEYLERFILCHEQVGGEFVSDSWLASRFDELHSSHKLDFKTLDRFFKSFSIRLQGSGPFEIKDDWKSFPECVRQHLECQELDIHSWKPSMTTSMIDCMNLRRLSIKLDASKCSDTSESAIDVIPTGIGSLIYLEEFRIEVPVQDFLSRYRIAHEIGKLKRLELLSIEFKCDPSTKDFGDDALITPIEIPLKLYDIPSLTKLQLKYLANDDSVLNVYPTLPHASVAPDCNKLANLSDLCIQGFGLNSLPESIGEIASLRNLNLKSNCLKSLPETFGNLKIKTIDLDYNRFEEFPECITRCSDLTVIAFEHNRLLDIPSSVFEMESLVELKLVGNKISKLHIKNATPEADLKELHFDEDESSYISPNIKLLKKLRNDESNMKSLPGDIERLISIEIMDCGENEPGELPTAIIHSTTFEQTMPGENQFCVSPKKWKDAKPSRFLRVSVGPVQTECKSAKPSSKINGWSVRKLFRNGAVGGPIRLIFDEEEDPDHDFYKNQWRTFNQPTPTLIKSPEDAFLPKENDSFYVEGSNPALAEILDGVYSQQPSSVSVNGRPMFVRISRDRETNPMAIWYHPKRNSWIIGRKSYAGHDIACAIVKCDVDHPLYIPDATPKPKWHDWDKKMKDFSENLNLNIRKATPEEIRRERPTLIRVSGRTGYNRLMNGLYARGEGLHRGKYYYQHINSDFKIRWYDSAPDEAGKWVIDHRFGLNNDNIGAAVIRENVPEPWLCTGRWRVYTGSNWETDERIEVSTRAFRVKWDCSDEMDGFCVE